MLFLLWSPFLTFFYSTIISFLKTLFLLSLISWFDLPSFSFHSVSISPPHFLKPSFFLYTLIFIPKTVWLILNLIKTIIGKKQWRTTEIVKNNLVQAKNLRRSDIFLVVFWYNIRQFWKERFKAFAHTTRILQPRVRKVNAGRMPLIKTLSTHQQQKDR